MVGGLGMRVPAQHQSHQCQAEINHAAHGWPRSNVHEKGPTSYQIGPRTLVSNRCSGRVGFVLPKIGFSIAASDNTIMSRENFAPRQLQGQCGQQQGGPFGEKPCACAACPPPLGFVLPKIGSGLNWICRHNQESRIWGGRGPIDDERHRKEPVEGWAFGASTGMRDLSTAWVRSAKSWI